MIIEYHWSLKIIDHLWKYVAQKQRNENMKISRPETMSGKIPHLVSDSKNISLRNRSKVFLYKKVWQTDRVTELQKGLTSGRSDIYSTVTFNRAAELELSIVSTKRRNANILFDRKLHNGHFWLLCAKALIRHTRIMSRPAGGIILQIQDCGVCSI